ncbi:MAG: type III secretion system chaperone [Pseudomonadota bacterium]
MITGLSRDFQLPNLDAQRDALIQFNIGEDIKLYIAFDEDHCVFGSQLAETSEVVERDPWIAFDAPEEWTKRRTRIGIEPESKSLMIMRDLFLQRMEYAAFAEALETFVSDVQAARQIIDPRAQPTGDGDDPGFDPALDGQVLLRP